jgi:hypothetical protein
VAEDMGVAALHVTQAVEFIAEEQGGADVHESQNGPHAQGKPQNEAAREALGEPSKRGSVFPGTTQWDDRCFSSREESTLGSFGLGGGWVLGVGVSGGCDWVGRPG